MTPLQFGHGHHHKRKQELLCDQAKRQAYPSNRNPLPRSRINPPSTGTLPPAVVSSQQVQRTPYPTPPPNNRPYTQPQPRAPVPPQKYLSPPATQPATTNRPAPMVVWQPPPEHRSSSPQCAMLKSTLNLGATLAAPFNAAAASVNNLHDGLHQRTTEYMNQGAALCDIISSRLNAIITSIDGEVFSGNENELVVSQTPPPPYAGPLVPSADAPGSANTRASPSPNGSNHFSKVWLYANSRMPPHLPPLKVYLPTWPLLCLAAQYSERVYARPTSAEHESHIEADWRAGTKAMVLKSVLNDDTNTIVFAIRGSQTFMDWAVNFRPAPSSPEGFLDDPGNLCHAGFLHVARSMIRPVAARLRQLITESPARACKCSLLITGHSAGGAVAVLLFAHMLSTSVSSELTELVPFFKRVHCVTFGAPPVSLLPLQKPERDDCKKSLFFAFVNEGDPVPRADRAVVGNLVKLYTSPSPASICSSIINLGTALLPLKTGKSKKPAAKKLTTGTDYSGPLPSWKVPPSTLSNAGRLVLLRNTAGAPAGQEHIEASTVTDAQLREVVFGDPICHMMKLYARRIEILATRAVTAGGFG